ncbi:MAG TPA: ABC transporter ATP-binding protein [Thermoanaerobaculia bacterium]
MAESLPLEISELHKSFGDRRALDGVSLMFGAGEILGLLGPNGAGKTTVVRSVVGRVRPDSGTVRVFGRPPDDPRSKASVGYVTQEIALYPLLSPAENLAAFGRFQGLRGEPLEKAVAHSLHWTGLAERAKERTERLSGGMKRRLNIAAGTIHGPRLLLLDEPTVGVDPQSRERIYQMIEELRRGGVSLLYTTHYMEEAERLCDRIAIIDNGKIIALGTKEDLVRSTVGAKQTLTIETESPVPPALKEALERRGGSVSDSTVHFSVTEPAREIPELLAAFRNDGVRIRDLTLKTATLESVFLQLTGRELRE